MTGDRYPQIVRTVSETPWAIMPEKLTAILELVELRASGREFSAEEIQARIGAGPATQQVSKSSTVAILPLFGVLCPRADLMSEISGATSLERFQASFRGLVDDPEIDAIVINVDSPGGSTKFCTETAALVRDARGTKPIVAVANTLCASAAYWIGSQADEFYASPSAMVGSIGVLTAHTDISGMEEKAGMKTTVVSAGDNKAEFSPFAPLSDDARAALQGLVDSDYAMFVADVAEGRGVSEAKVLADFGQGRVVPAQAALAAGMVDGVATFEETVSRLVATTAAQNPPSYDASARLSFADDAERAHTHVTAFVARAESLARLRANGGRDLSAANRERLSALNVSLLEASGALVELLAAPEAAVDDVRRALEVEHLRSLQLP